MRELSKEEREALIEALRPPIKWGDHGTRVVQRLLDVEDAEFVMETLGPAIEAIITADRGRMEILEKEILRREVRLTVVRATCAAISRRLTRVEALADEWADEANLGAAGLLTDLVADLRAALSVPTEAEETDRG